MWDGGLGGFGCEVGMFVLGFCLFLLMCCICEQFKIGVKSGYYV